MGKAIEIIHQKIKRAINDDVMIQVIDDSHKHVGHKGSTGGGHFRVTVISDIFQGLSRIQRHTMIMNLFKEDIPHTIHALSLSLLTRDENSACIDRGRTPTIVKK